MEKREIAYMRFGHIDFLVGESNAHYFQENIQNRRPTGNPFEVYKFDREKDF